MIKDYEKYMFYMKDFNNELMELNIKYNETIEEQKMKIEKRERIIKGLIVEAIIHTTMNLLELLGYSD